MRWLVLAALCVATAARADDRPWAKDVPEPEQKEALRLYDLGNKSFEDSEYKPALEKYEQALAHWKHPAIYFNAAVCLFNLDRVVEAYDYIEKALAYGDAPFDKKLYKQARDYEKLLAPQVTELEVVCKQSGAEITLDGETLIKNCPAAESRKLLVSREHTIVGKKPGYEPQTIGPIKLGPGAKKTIEIVLRPAEKGHLVRRWPKAVPWYVVAGGGVVALSSFVPLYFASKHIESYDIAVGKQCPMGCPASAVPDLQALEDKGKTDFTIARVLFVGGGAIAAVGFAMVVLNQPRLEHAPVVAPAIGPGTAGVTISGRW